MIFLSLESEKSTGLFSDNVDASFEDNVEVKIYEENVVPRVDPMLLNAY